MYISSTDKKATFVCINIKNHSELIHTQKFPSSFFSYFKNKVNYSTSLFKKKLKKIRNIYPRTFCHQLLLK